VADLVKFSPRLPRRLDEAFGKLEEVESLLRAAHDLVENHTPAPEGTDPGLVAEFIRDAMGSVCGARSSIANAGDVMKTMAGKKAPPMLKPNDRLMLVEVLKTVLDASLSRPREVPDQLRTVIADLEAVR
jgi:hypothetical protein